MTAFTTRYGDPAYDGHGAHVRGYERHGCTVVAVSGRIDGANVADVLDYVAHVTVAGMPLVLDLSGVSAATPNCVRLLRAVADRADAGWALVAGDAVRERLRGRDGEIVVPLADSVAHAEHHFDEAATARRRAVLPLLGRTA